VVQTLQRFVIALDKHVHEKGNKQYDYLLRQSLRYRHIRSILKKSQADALADGFFDGLHGLRTAKRDPLFWVQCSIAKSAVGAFAKCEDYILTARSYADGMKSTGYDPYQVDTHEAGFLVISRSQNYKTDVGFAFQRSVKLLEGVISRRDEDLERTLEVTTMYWDYYSVYKGQIDEITTANICNMLKRIRSRIDLYDKNVLERNKVGDRAKHSIDQVLQTGRHHS